MKNDAINKRISSITAIVIIAVLFSVITLNIITKTTTRTIAPLEDTNPLSSLYISVQGNIKLGGLQQATVELYTDDNQLIATQEIADTGNYKFDINNEGIYYLLVRQAGYLEYKTGSFEVLFGYTVTLNDIDMIYGDFNGDNEIDLLDLVQIEDNYRALSEIENSVYDANNDKKIDENDKTIVKNNYGIKSEIQDAEYSVSYTIIYNANGGNKAPDNQIKPSTEDVEIAENVPVYENYKFVGWGLTQNAETVEYGPGDLYQANESIILYAIWENAQYTIEYQMNGGTNTNDNPTEYTSLDDNINLIEPTRDGYDFIGWIGSNGQVPELNVTIPTGSMGNKEFEAVWSPRTDIPYKVECYTQNLEGTDYELSEVLDLLGISDETIVAPDKKIPGFTFEEDNVNNVIQGLVDVDGSLILKRYYTRNSYKLNAIAGANISATVGTGTYKYGQEITIGATVKQETGYKYIFENWTSSDSKLLEDSEKQSYTFNMPAGNIDITANARMMSATDSTYNVQYYLETLTQGQYQLYSTTTNLGTVNTQVTATIKTYIGFTHDSTNSNNVLSGKVTSPDILTLKVYYKRNSYTLTTTAGTYISSVTGGGTYKYGQSVTINATVASATGYTYTFSKWTSSDTTAVANSTTKSTVIKMPAKAITMTASASRTPIKYTISYTMNSGTVAGANPSTYTVATNSITLINPTRTGYVFKGWTGSNGTTPSKTVTIAKGSTGNKSYTANWTDTILPTSPTLVATGTAGSNGWYRSKVSVKVTQGTDAGSGVSKTTYAVTGATTVAETAITSGNSISISNEGTSTIKAYTYDKSGNKSAAKTLTIKKDTVAPTIKTGLTTLNSATVSVSKLSVSIGVNSTDSTSGIWKHVFYKDDSTLTSNTYSSVYANTKVKFRTYDVAGNSAITKQYTYFNRYAFIAQVYEKMLGRPAKLDEAEYWSISRYSDYTNAGKSGKELQYVALDIATSDEALKRSDTLFINNLYLAFLGRNYESDVPKNAMIAKLSSGMSRREIIMYVLESPEFKQICTKWGYPYSSVL